LAGEATTPIPFQNGVRLTFDRTRMSHPRPKTVLTPNAVSSAMLMDPRPIPPVRKKPDVGFG